jgi:cytochrome c oxidase subunit 3
MQIPHEVTARPDTGLYNAKLGIWLFLASEVMLFGGLFSAYIFLRVGSDDGYWPHGLLNVPIGTFNTAVLIASSVTVVLAWASLKMRQWAKYKLYMGITILCGILFLFIKLYFEWPVKFVHFGAFIKKDKWAQYEEYLGNKHLAEKGLAPRPEISGHLEAVEVSATADALKAFAEAHELEVKPAMEKKEGGEPAMVVEAKRAEDGVNPQVAEKLIRLPGVKPLAFEVKLDEVNADPDSPENDRPHFIPRPLSEKVAKIQYADISSWSSFAPKHSSYFAVYFTITGLHGLHVLAGVLIFCYFFLFGEKLYRKNPEHMANRVEVGGLFWHFVDLVWIFVFPIFYLL